VSEFIKRIKKNNLLRQIFRLASFA